MLSNLEKYPQTNIKHWVLPLTFREGGENILPYNYKQALGTMKFVLRINKYEPGLNELFVEKQIS